MCETVRVPPVRDRRIVAIAGGMDLELLVVVVVVVMDIKCNLI
jgi:hypothetical protein